MPSWEGGEGVGPIRAAAFVGGDPVSAGFNDGYGGEEGDEFVSKLINGETDSRLAVAASNVPGEWSVDSPNSEEIICSLGGVSPPRVEEIRL